MCKMCDEGNRQDHPGSLRDSRRDFLKTATTTAVAAAGLNSCSRRVAANEGDDPPDDSGRRGRRYVIRGGAVMSMDPDVGDFAKPTCWSRARRSSPSGRTCTRAAPRRSTPRGRIVMPGFIDTHHHQFETALRSFLADGVLINDGSGSPSGNTTYFEYILLQFAPVYRPQDVYINELFGCSASSTPASRRCTTSRRSITRPQHSDAAIQALHRYRAPRRLRLFRERGRRIRHQSRQPISERRAPHQEAVVLLERPARPHDHGRRGLSWRSDYRPVLDDRAPARPPDCGAHPLAVRHPPDL